MLLKSLKLKDFRQFKGEQYVSFANDPERNVTIIMGENGSGKTSFAQAFRWCLYGETDFSDPILLSRAVSENMLPGDEHEVQVDIELTHNNTDYSIIRRQKYRKDPSGRIVSASGQNKFVVGYKADDGNMKYLPDLDTHIKIKEILPADLSRYFFFDGERIEKMSKDIHNGKSKDIGEAVKSLLGLNAFISSSQHLKKVIRRYNDSYSGNTDSQIVRLISEIKQLEEEEEKITARIAELDNLEELAQDECEKLKARIEKSHDSEQLSQQRKAILHKLETLDVGRKEKLSLLLKLFNANAPRYFPKKMMKNALVMLKNAEALDKGIPDIHARTIDFLIKRGFCLCGNHIEVGNDAFNELNKLRDYIPPKSVGNLISEFTAACEEKTKSTETFSDSFNTNVRDIFSYEDTKADLEDDLLKINERLKGLEDVGSLAKDLMSYEKNIRDYKEERDEQNQILGAKRDALKNKSQERTRLSQGSVANRKIETYRAYAEYICNTLNEEYSNKETETREKLAKTINEIFKNIYNGGFSLSLDEKYNVLLSADGSKLPQGDDIETSTAQSISIIFAFIAGVIKMAKENQNSDDRIAQTEPYPLVMDAPLSAFDKKRINTVCDVLPNIAEQVIIFIKDTDGELAENYLGQKVGKRYKFAKKTEFETDLTEVG